MNIKKELFKETKLTRNQYKELAHSNAVEKGFWEVQHSYEHSIMLVISEVCEAVEAYRNNHKSDYDAFQRDNELLELQESFKKNIKNTVEDEIADIYIRLFDYAGAINLDFDDPNNKSNIIKTNYKSFLEECFEIVRIISRGNDNIHSICVALDYLDLLVKHWNIPISWHILKKMKYNSDREYKHGKIC